MTVAVLFNRWSQVLFYEWEYWEFSILIMCKRFTDVLCKSACERLDVSTIFGGDFNRDFNV